MKRVNFFGTVIVCLTFIFLLSSCQNNRDLFNTQVRPDLSRENWLRSVNLDPNIWVQASPWFYAGITGSEGINKYGAGAPYSMAITKMSVRVSDFTNIQIDGPYRVQIVGGQDHNSLYIYGSNAAARMTAVDMRNNTLFIHPPHEVRGLNLNSVIVRIGVHNLGSLVYNGNGSVEGKNIQSGCLSVVANGAGSVLLSGNINLTSVRQSGMAKVTVIGAYTPSLDITAMGGGVVNISGRVGIRTIVNQGGGRVNIIGADSDNLCITAGGSTCTSVAGYSNLRKLTAMGHSHVYLYWVNSSGTYVNIYDNARVGLAGAGKNINIEASGNSRFEGQYLHADNIYVRTRQYSHANVNPGHKMFAAAMDSSSIYFFGSPNIVSRYATTNAVVLPVWGDACPVTALPPPAVLAFTPVPVKEKITYDRTYK